ncbi:MAG: hypothetical protein WC761_03760 [Candidatus Paceibacterota bacterium]
MKEIILTISVSLYFISFIPYLVGMLKGTVRPRPLSWLGWALLLGVALFSQILERGFDATMLISFSSAIICTTIFILSMTRSHSKNESFDYICLFLGIVCMIVYFTSKDAFVTTVFSIVSDLLVGIPTVLSVYKNPRAEDMLAWGMGTFAISLSFVVAMLESDYLLKLYPAYLFAFNALIFILCLRRFKLPV